MRALGSRHSFNDIADTTGVLISLADMPKVLEIDREARTVTVDAGARYGDVCLAIDAAGLALHSMASLPHISVAGACATGTHGSGDSIGNLATAVVGMDLVAPDGEFRRIGVDGGDLPLAGSVVSLGALGVVSRLTLRAEPTYQVRQDVFDDLPIAAFRERFEAVMAAGDSVSGFLDWRRDVIDQVWVKRRVDGSSDGAAGPVVPSALAGARTADGPRHPIRGMSADACTEQLGAPGPWHERLPHFRLDHVPSGGEELQSEYLLPRVHAVDALDALLKPRERLVPLTLVSEIRTVAADDLWLSPAYGRATVAFHFTWRRDQPAVDALLPDIERALEPFEPRPHWGKRFAMGADVLRTRHPRWDDFLGLRAALDPDGRFRNDFLRRHLTG
jgi:xylitol oxidase